MWGFPRCKYFYAIYAQIIEMGVGVIFFFLRVPSPEQECVEVLPCKYEMIVIMLLQYVTLELK